MLCVYELLFMLIYITIALFNSVDQLPNFNRDLGHIIAVYIYLTLNIGS